MSRWARPLGCCLSLCANACAADGYVLVSVDTDLPVPTLVDRMRIDVFAVRAELHWIASRDFAIAVDAPDAGVVGAPLPASFSIDATQGGTMLVRVRGYHSGNIRDFSHDAEPRSSVPDMPRTEPEPGLSVDTLALFELDPDRAEQLTLVLRGECLGVPASLSDLTTCSRNDALSAPVRDSTLTGVHEAPSESLAGTWPALATGGCDEAEDGETVVCLEAAAFILGDEAIVDFGPAAATPRRPAVLSAFVVDRYEYTLGRYRAALDAGFEPGPGAPSLQPLDLVTCGSSNGADPPIFPTDDDAMPLSCVDWNTAEQLCEFEGGHLPTEAQWERAAAASSPTNGEGRRYPWRLSESELGCDSALFGRSTDATGDTFCASLGFGPRGVDATPWAQNDVTPEGVVGLGGNLAEWTSDSYAAYDAACWREQGLHDPACARDGLGEATVRGGSWRDSLDRTRAASRRGAAPASKRDYIGFRCVYSDLTTSPK